MQECQWVEFKVDLVYNFKESLEIVLDKRRRASWILRMTHHLHFVVLWQFQVSITLHLKCVPYQRSECFNQWFYHTIALSFRCKCNKFVFDLPWYYSRSKGFQSSWTFLDVNLICKVEVVVLLLMVKLWRGRYRRAHARVRIVRVLSFTSVDFGNDLEMISTLSLVLDNFSLMQRCFMTVSLKQANNLKIVNFLFDMDISWPCDMLSLDCCRG